MLKLAALLAGAIALPLASNAVAAGPSTKMSVENLLGISWGQSLAETKQLGVTFSRCEQSGKATICEADGDNWAKDYGPKSTVISFFIEGEGLHKAAVLTHFIIDDYYATGGHKAYGDMKTMFSLGFGEAVSVETVPKGKHFYTCLLDEDCGVWGSLWEVPTGTVIMQLEAYDKESANLATDYISPDYRRLTGS